MTHQQRAEELAHVVATELDLNENSTFGQYWELYKQTANVSNIEGLFIRTEGRSGYCNVVILGDGRIVDIEVEERARSGGLHIRPLSSVSEVHLHRGSLPQLPYSEGALLVVMLGLTGMDESGPYWAAQTRAQERKLLGFAQALIEAISDR